MNPELTPKNSIARANEVGPMRFWSFLGPASVLQEYGLFFEELNATDEDLRRFNSCSDDSTRARAHRTLNDLTVFGS